MILKVEDFKTKLCKNCINFLELEKDSIECDYDMFDKTAKQKTELYTPIEFDCIHYEEIDDIE